MVIQHNVLAANAQRQYNITEKRKKEHTEKLSSGYRINKAADDAAGLSISEKMRRQVRGLTRGVQNAEDGVSLCQVADGALNEVHDMIQRLNELSVQASNGTNSDSDRGMIQEEVGQLLTEIDRISDTTTFNGQNIFGGAKVGEITTAQTTQAAPTEPTTPAAPTKPVVSGQKKRYGSFWVTGDTDGVEFTNGVLKLIRTTKIIIQNVDPDTPTTDRIEVGSGVNADIILKNVNINSSTSAAFMIEDNSTGNVNIFLEGTNKLKSGADCAGLQKNGAGSGIGKLTISGSGSLTATGSSSGVGIGGGAGIGGGNEGAGSNITIYDGTVEATSGKYGAGIGGGFRGAGSNITISGGKVTATSIGNFCGAGIGGGGVDIEGIGRGCSGAGSNITISGGIVTANGGDYGAGIGGGVSGAGSDITISGGKVTANGGAFAAGIGGGNGGRGDGSNITISGGIVTANGGTYGAGIGGGNYGDGSDIAISGGIVTANGGYNGAGIGGGNSGGYGGAGSNITISGGKVTATGGQNGAGIGGGNNGDGSNITISDGKVTATGGVEGAGIGGGGSMNDISGAGSNITISGGSVEAAGGNGGAGIGGGDNAAGSDITISGGNGKVTGGTDAQNIGSGRGIADDSSNKVDGNPAPKEATDRNAGTYEFNLPDKPIAPPADLAHPSSPEFVSQSSTAPLKKWWIQSGNDANDGMNIYIDTMNTKVLGLTGLNVARYRVPMPKEMPGGRTVGESEAEYRRRKAEYEKMRDADWAEYEKTHAITKIDGALTYVSRMRAKIGAQQNRLEHTIANENNIVENTTAAESRIRDADMAKEMVGFSLSNILAQAGETMMSQANQSNQGVMTLLG